jgi:membrane fusion protein, copper/silver efflux system
MTRATVMLALAATLAAGAAWYWGGRNSVPMPELTSSALGEAAKPKPASGPVVYYRHPDGKPLYSASPKKTPDGRDFVAVLASEDVSFNKPKPAKTADGPAPKRIRYYRNPMGLPDTSPVPKKDSMGMDYMPVYEGEDEDGSTVKISPGKLQRTGVRSEPVARRVLTAPIRAPGVVEADEHKQMVVALRFDAFIEKLGHVTTGSFVRKGEPMMRLYSSTLSAAAAQYLTDLSARESTVLASSRGARQRLENLGLPESMIKDIERARQGTLSVEWPAPLTGFVTEHNIVEGMQAKTGDTLFRIADVSTVWVLADVAEHDLGSVAAGQAATVRARTYPGRSFTGKILLVYPTINKETRTARVRIELTNPDYLLKPNMYTDVEIASGSDQPVLAVPDNAVIDSGTRKIVIIDKGDGRFEPREVQLGPWGGGYIEIRDGVTAGDKVVVAANFLIDAESNLKAALQSLAAAGETK